MGGLKKSSESPAPGLGTVVPLAKVRSQEKQLGGSTEFSWGAVEFEGTGRPVDPSLQLRGVSSPTGVRQVTTSYNRIPRNRNLCGASRVRGACPGDFERMISAGKRAQMVAGL